MRPFYVSALLFLAALASGAAACGSAGGGRPVQVVMTDTTCLPNPIAIKTGEKVTFELKNDGKNDQEFEGIDGTKIEELLVPAGRTRKVDYTAPSQPGTQKAKCYIPGGFASIVELVVS